MPLEPSQTQAAFPGDALHLLSHVENVGSAPVLASSMPSEGLGLVPQET